MGCRNRLMVSAEKNEILELVAYRIACESSIRSGPPNTMSPGDPGVVVNGTAVVNTGLDGGRTEMTELPVICIAALRMAVLDNTEIMDVAERLGLVVSDDSGLVVVNEMNVLAFASPASGSAAVMLKMEMKLDAEIDCVVAKLADVETIDETLDPARTMLVVRPADVETIDDVEEATIEICVNRIALVLTTDIVDVAARIVSTSGTPSGPVAMGRKAGI